MSSTKREVGSHTRLIDKLPDPPNPPQMEILLLGMPRTGTISMRLAFEALGYKPFHGREMDKNTHLLPLWVECLQAKYYGTCEVYGKKEYDKLFAGWNVSCNIPGSLVAEDLIKAYPNAKIVLSTRDVDKWMRSMKESVDLAIKWKSFDWLAPWEPHRIGAWWRYHKFQHGLRPILAPNGERQAYLDYYERIGQLVPPERVLYFNPAEGWEPLCKFLNKDIPDTPFPKVNNTNQFLAERTRRWWLIVGVALSKIARVTVPTLAVLWCSWWVWSKKPSVTDILTSAKSFVFPLQNNA